MITLLLLVRATYMLAGTEFAKKLWGGQTLLFEFR